MIAICLQHLSKISKILRETYHIISLFISVQARRLSALHWLLFLRLESDQSSLCCLDTLGLTLCSLGVDITEILLRVGSVFFPEILHHTQTVPCTLGTLYYEVLTFAPIEPRSKFKAGVGDLADDQLQVLMPASFVP